MTWPVDLARILILPSLSSSSSSACSSLSSLDDDERFVEVFLSSCLAATSREKRPLRRETLKKTKNLPQANTNGHSSSAFFSSRILKELGEIVRSKKLRLRLRQRRFSPLRKPLSRIECQTSRYAEDSVSGQERFERKEKEREEVEKTSSSLSCETMSLRVEASSLSSFLKKAFDLSSSYQSLFLSVESSPAGSGPLVCTRRRGKKEGVHTPETNPNQGERRKTIHSPSSSSACGNEIKTGSSWLERLKSRTEERRFPLRRGCPSMSSDLCLASSEDDERTSLPKKEKSPTTATSSHDEKNLPSSSSLSCADLDFREIFVFEEREKDLESELYLRHQLLLLLLVVLRCYLPYLNRRTSASSSSFPSSSLCSSVGCPREKESLGGADSQGREKEETDVGWHPRRDGEGTREEEKKEALGASSSDPLFLERKEDWILFFKALVTSIEAVYVHLLHRSRVESTAREAREAQSTSASHAALPPRLSPSNSMGSGLTSAYNEGKKDDVLDRLLLGKKDISKELNFVSRRSETVFTTPSSAAQIVRCIGTLTSSGGGHQKSGEKTLSGLLHFLRSLRDLLGESVRYLSTHPSLQALVETAALEENRLLTLIQLLQPLTVAGAVYVHPPPLPDDDVLLPSSPSSRPSDSYKRANGGEGGGLLSFSSFSSSASSPSSSCCEGGFTDFWARRRGRRGERGGLTDLPTSEHERSSDRSTPTSKGKTGKEESLEDSLSWRSCRQNESLSYGACEGKEKGAALSFRKTSGRRFPLVEHERVSDRTGQASQEEEEEERRKKLGRSGEGREDGTRGKRREARWLPENEKMRRSFHCPSPHPLQQKATVNFPEEETDEKRAESEEEQEGRRTGRGKEARPKKVRHHSKRGGGGGGGESIDGRSRVRSLALDCIQLAIRISPKSLFRSWSLILRPPHGFRINFSLFSSSPSSLSSSSSGRVSEVCLGSSVLERDRGRLGGEGEGYRRSKETLLTGRASQDSRPHPNSNHASLLSSSTDTRHLCLDTRSLRSSSSSSSVSFLPSLSSGQWASSLLLVDTRLTRLSLHQQLWMSIARLDADVKVQRSAVDCLVSLLETSPLHRWPSTVLEPSPSSFVSSGQEASQLPLHSFFSRSSPPSSHRLPSSLALKRTLQPLAPHQTTSKSSVSVPTPPSSSTGDSCPSSSLLMKTDDFWMCLLWLWGRRGTEEEKEQTSPSPPHSPLSSTNCPSLVLLPSSSSSYPFLVRKGGVSSSFNTLSENLFSSTRLVFFQLFAFTEDLCQSFNLLHDTLPLLSSSSSSCSQPWVLSDDPHLPVAHQSSSQTSPSTAGWPSSPSSPLSVGSSDKAKTPPSPAPLAPSVRDFTVYSSGGPRLMRSLLSLEIPLRALTRLIRALPLTAFRPGILLACLRLVQPFFVGFLSFLLSRSLALSSSSSPSSSLQSMRALIQHLSSSRSNARRLFFLSRAASEGGADLYSKYARQASNVFSLSSSFSSSRSEEGMSSSTCGVLPEERKASCLVHDRPRKEAEKAEKAENKEDGEHDDADVPSSSRERKAYEETRERLEESMEVTSLHVSILSAATALIASIVSVKPFSLEVLEGLLLSLSLKRAPFPPSREIFDNARASSSSSPSPSPPAGVSVVQPERSTGERRRRRVGEERGSPRSEEQKGEEVEFPGKNGKEHRKERTSDGYTPLFFAPSKPHTTRLEDLSLINLLLVISCVLLYIQEAPRHREPQDTSPSPPAGNVLPSSSSFSSESSSSSASSPSGTGCSRAEALAGFIPLSSRERQDEASEGRRPEKREEEKENEEVVRRQWISERSGAEDGADSSERVLDHERERQDKKNLKKKKKKESEGGGEEVRKALQEEEEEDDEKGREERESSIGRREKEFDAVRMDTLREMFLNLLSRRIAKTYPEVFFLSSLLLPLPHSPFKPAETRGEEATQTDCSAVSLSPARSSPPSLLQPQRHSSSSSPVVHQSASSSSFCSCSAASFSQPLRFLREEKKQISFLSSSVNCRLSTNSGTEERCPEVKSFSFGVVACRETSSLFILLLDLLLSSSSLSREEGGGKSGWQCRLQGLSLAHDVLPVIPRDFDMDAHGEKEPSTADEEEKKKKGKENKKKMTDDKKEVSCSCSSLSEAGQEGEEEEEELSAFERRNFLKRRMREAGTCMRKEIFDRVYRHVWYSLFFGVAEEEEKGEEEQEDQEESEGEEEEEEAAAGGGGEGGEGSWPAVAEGVERSLSFHRKQEEREEEEEELDVIGRADILALHSERVKGHDEGREEQEENEKRDEQKELEEEEDFVQYESFVIGACDVLRQLRYEECLRSYPCFLSPSFGWAVASLLERHPRRHWPLPLGRTSKLVEVGRRLGEKIVSTRNKEKSSVRESWGRFPEEPKTAAVRRAICESAENEEGEKGEEKKKKNSVSSPSHRPEKIAAEDEEEKREAICNQQEEEAKKAKEESDSREGRKEKERERERRGGQANGEEEEEKRSETSRRRKKRNRRCLYTSKLSLSMEIALIGIAGLYVQNAGLCLRSSFFSKKSPSADEEKTFPQVPMIEAEKKINHGGRGRSRNEDEEGEEECQSPHGQEEDNDKEEEAKNPTERREEEEEERRGEGIVFMEQEEEEEDGDDEPKKKKKKVEYMLRVSRLACLESLKVLYEGSLSSRSPFFLNQRLHAALAKALFDIFSSSSPPFSSSSSSSSSSFLSSSCLRDFERGELGALQALMRATFSKDCFFYFLQDEKEEEEGETRSDRGGNEEETEGRHSPRWRCGKSEEAEEEKRRRTRTRRADSNPVNMSSSVFTDSIRVMGSICRVFDWRLAFSPRLSCSSISSEEREDALESRVAEERKTSRLGRRSAARGFSFCFFIQRLHQVLLLALGTPKRRNRRERPREEGEGGGDRRQAASRPQEEDAKHKKKKKDENEDEGDHTEEAREESGRRPESKENAQTPGEGRKHADESGGGGRLKTLKKERNGSPGVEKKEEEEKRGGGSVLPLKRGRVKLRWNACYAVNLLYSNPTFASSFRANTPLLTSVLSASSSSSSSSSSSRSGPPPSPSPPPRSLGEASEKIDAQTLFARFRGGILLGLSFCLQFSSSLKVQIQAASALRTVLSSSSSLSRQSRSRSALRKKQKEEEEDEDVAFFLQDSLEGEVVFGQFLPKEIKVIWRALALAAASSSSSSSSHGSDLSRRFEETAEERNGRNENKERPGQEEEEGAEKKGGAKENKEELKEKKKKEEEKEEKEKEETADHHAEDRSEKRRSKNMNDKREEREETKKKKKLESEPARHEGTHALQTTRAYSRAFSSCNDLSSSSSPSSSSSRCSRASCLLEKYRAQLARQLKLLLTGRDSLLPSITLLLFYSFYTRLERKEEKTLNGEQSPSAFSSPPRPSSSSSRVEAFGSEPAEDFEELQCEWGEEISLDKGLQEESLGISPVCYTNAVLYREDDAREVSSFKQNEVEECMQVVSQALGELVRCRLLPISNPTPQSPRSCPLSLREEEEEESLPSSSSSFPHYHDQEHAVCVSPSSSSPPSCPSSHEREEGEDQETKKKKKEVEEGALRGPSSPLRQGQEEEEKKKRRMTRSFARRLPSPHRETIRLLVSLAELRRLQEQKEQKCS